MCWCWFTHRLLLKLDIKAFKVLLRGKIVVPEIEFRYTQLFDTKLLYITLHYSTLTNCKSCRVVSNMKPTHYVLKNSLTCPLYNFYLKDCGYVYCANHYVYQICVCFTYVQKSTLKYLLLIRRIADVISFGTLRQPQGGGKSPGLIWVWFFCK